MEVIELFRILALTNALKSNRSYQLTFDKLIMLDFCLEHSKIMVEEDMENLDFDTINSYYHLQPSRDSYYKRLNILMAKGLLEKRILRKQYSYVITEAGIKLCDDFENETFSEMKINAKVVAKTYKGKSVSDLQNEMYTKTKEVLLS